MEQLTPQSIIDAARLISPHVKRTPVLTCQSLNRLVGAELYFKCENFQKVGAFKFRGATHALLSQPAAHLARGVATHSSGNHAQAVALAASLQGIPAYIVMPANAPKVKREAVAGYGGRIYTCEPTLQAREDTLAAVLNETGADFIHPYNDERVIAGQGTAALELLQEVPGLDLLIVPVGGGGLLSGTALAAQTVYPKPRVVAAEPAGADDAYRSFYQGQLLPATTSRTIADGLLTSLGDKTFPLIRQYVDQIITVGEAGIVAAMRLIWERMKIIVEPSAAVPLGALLEGSRLPGQHIGIILSGGNVDLDQLPWLTSGPGATT